ncbi:peptidylprolyl isomerase [Caulobacter sp. S45]|uniref:peptidylprolyl isomerase n=1 Tax=Caulobacter sp. S45 TaxID=1641861 RepID=UPI001575E87B|nr:peptidylprolyl isomerase [Caulobacter sp. S45]
MNDAAVEDHLDLADDASGRPDAVGRPTLWNPRQPNARRSLLLCGVGALAGLLIAGFGLFTAQGTRTFVVPPEDAATVNGVPILRADVIGQLRALDDVSLGEATPAQKHKVLADMVREELYVQRGVELGAPTDDTDVRQALVAGTEAVVAQDALTSRPSEAELHGWYDAHQDTYAGEGQMTVQDVRLPSAQATGADKIVAALRSGSTPAALDLKGSGRLTGDAQFYFAARIHLGDALFAVARRLKDGEVSAPVAEPDGVHILVMTHNQQPLPASYQDAHDRVLRDFLAAKVARLQAGNERFLRRRADIKIAGDFK